MPGQLPGLSVEEASLTQQLGGVTQERVLVLVGDSCGCWSPSPTHFAEGLGSSKAKVICFFYCRGMACVYLRGWEFNSVANDQINKRTMKSSATAPRPHKT